MQRRDFLMGLGSALVLLSSTNLICSAQQQGESAATRPMDQPIYPAQNTNEADLLQQCAPFLALSIDAIKALIPPQGGFLFSGCPNCQGGTGDDNLAWNIALGDKIECKYCKVVLPNEKYPNNGSVSIETPLKTQQVFNYHQTAAGKRYWFEARRWFDQRHTLEQATYLLAQLYRLNPVKHRAAGERCVAILTGFAAAYPAYVIKYENPGTDKMFLPYGKPVKEAFGQAVGSDYAARWSAWRYIDLSTPMLLAYDQLAGKDIVSAAERQEIEVTLFGGMAKFVADNELAINNMSPTIWRSQAIASNVLSQPGIATDILPGIAFMLRTDFTYDSFWKEGTLSYHRQTVGGFQNVLDALYPPGISPPKGDTLAAEVFQSIKVMDDFRLPNGHWAAINDTWGEEKYRGEAITESRPHLLPGMGYGILGLGKNEKQVQAHLKFTGRYGHTHYDSLNLLLFAGGHELVTDMGYTHNKSRPWASSTAAHNTVTIDQHNQALGTEPRNALGNLHLFNTSDESFQVIEASATEAYPGLATEYKRTLITVQTPGKATYVVDIFNVAGGAQHDWMLHGTIDAPQKIELLSASGQPLPAAQPASLLPNGFEFTPAKSEVDYPLIQQGPWAFGHFRDVTKTSSAATVKATFAIDGQPGKGLQSWIIGSPNTDLFTARSWSVRGVTDQAKLDEKLRSSLIVRRHGNASRFVAVHTALDSGLNIRSVSAQPWPGKGFLLKIEHGGGTDTILYQPESRLNSGLIEGQAIQFDGRIALIRGDITKPQLKAIGGSTLQIGRKVLKNTSASAKLLGVKGNRLVVEGAFKIAPGEVVIVQHGGGQTSAFHVVKTEKAGANTSIQTSEPAVFAMNANGSLKMQFFPHLQLMGPHRVTTNALASQT